MTERSVAPQDYAFLVQQVVDQAVGPEEQVLHNPELGSTQIGHQ